MEIAMRVLGLWCVFTAVSSLIRSVHIYATFISGGQVTGFSFLSYLPLVTEAVVLLLLGASLIWWAPWIAARFYPARPSGSEVGGILDQDGRPLAENPASSETRVQVGPGDLYRIACFVLGVYLLVQTAAPAGRLVVAGMGGMIGWSRGQSIVDGVVVMVYVVVGLVLVFGSQGIGRFLSSLRHDPDSIPKPQFSLMMLLLFIVAVAVVLGVIRALVTSGP
jgi:hypothetical protein